MFVRSPDTLSLPPLHAIELIYALQMKRENKATKEREESSKPEMSEEEENSANQFQASIEAT